MISSIKNHSVTKEVLPRPKNFIYKLLGYSDWRKKGEYKCTNFSQAALKDQI